MLVELGKHVRQSLEQLKFTLLRLETIDGEGFLNQYVADLVAGRRVDDLPIDQFPKRLTLSSDWQIYLDRLRIASSRDCYERFAVLGAIDNRVVCFPVTPVKGTKTDIPAKTQNRVLRMARNFGVTTVGIIHSHIRFGSGLLEYPENLRKPGFSPLDIIDQVVLPGRYPLAVLVDGFHNLFLFRTQETCTKNLNAGLSKEEAVKVALNGRWFADHWIMSLRLAEEYNLVLYRGVRDKDPVRYNPSSSLVGLAG